MTLDWHAALVVAAMWAVIYLGTRLMVRHERARAAAARNRAADERAWAVWEQQVAERVELAKVQHPSARPCITSGAQAVEDYANGEVRR